MAASLASKLMPKFDTPLAVMSLTIIAFGTVMVASASVAHGTVFWHKHLLSTGLGVGLFALAALLPLTVWQRMHRLGWVLAFVLCCAVLIPGIGVQVNGAYRWIDLGVARVHVAEYVKLLVLIYLAGYLARYQLEVHKGRASEALPVASTWELLRPLLLVGVVLALLLLEPDFGSVVVLAISVCALIFVAGVRLRLFLLMALLVVAAIALLAVAQPYRMERLISFTDPWAFAYGSGYQLTQALIAFGRGGYFGLGLGEGVQKLFYLPEAHNDFIFAVVVEELGLLGALALVLVFCFLVLRILRVARLALQRGHRFGGFLATGIGVLLGVQCLINFGVNTGLLPTKGLTLPFVSYGGHSLMVSYLMLGLVFRVAMDSEAADG